MKAQKEVREFKKKFKAAIELYRPKAVRALKALLKGKIPAGLEILQFETDSQSWEEVGVLVYALDRYSSEVSRRSPYGGRALFTSTPFLSYKILNFDYYEKKINTTSIGTKLLGNWLCACWREAGGHRFPFRVFFQHHDDVYYLDLNSTKWKTG